MNIRQKEISIEELNHNGLFSIHFNARDNNKITYISDKLCLEVFNKEKEEVLELGPDLIINTSPLESWKNAKILSSKLSYINNKDLGIAFFQTFFPTRRQKSVSVYTLRKILDKDNFI
mgnify:CR=1 FL=1